ncbi:MAG: DUF2520 domain-containing protein [Clostridiales Family XIII bacterium]|jgi:predicted short-subunit dehydrogenase-like oxidoreductase (DUF2520 family)|nr:DUF2520 domain-containing protein [Clostridiales Family XIII bacterium]
MKESARKRVGFIGAGKAGVSMGKLLAEKCGSGSLSGYFSKTPASAAAAAVFTDSCRFATAQELIAASGVVFVTVPDGVISELWAEVNQTPAATGRVFCHMSGSLTSEAFAGAGRIGAHACSFHPLCAISDKNASWETLGRAYFTFEGSDEAYAALEPFIHGAALRTEKLDASKKALYHAACVYLSNFVVGLAHEGERLLRESGLPADFAKEAWHSLFFENARNIVNKGSVAALTGPAERGDTDTVRRHLAMLDGGERTLYVAMTRILAGIAEKKHPDRDYSALHALR